MKNIVKASVYYHRYVKHTFKKWGVEFSRIDYAIVARKVLTFVENNPRMKYRTFECFMDRYLEKTMKES